MKLFLVAVALVALLEALPVPEGTGVYAALAFGAWAVVRHSNGEARADADQVAELRRLRVTPRR